MFEVPFVLRWIKPFRVLSLMSAIAYNILFLGSVVDFFVVTDFEDEDTIEEDGFGDMFISLIIFYNLVENFPIVIINCGIMIKEAILPFFQLVSNMNVPKGAQAVDISIVDFGDTFWFFSNLSNPAWYLQQILKLILGWDPADMVIENKNDEEHYYAKPIIQPVKGWFGIH